MAVSSIPYGNTIDHFDRYGHEYIMKAYTTGYVVIGSTLLHSYVTASPCFEPCLLL